jgi:predicted HD superfamily hydrolase involved in NAD metabolism
MTDYPDLEARLKSKLPPERFEHSQRVVECAEELGQHYKLNLGKVRQAALLHDCSRYLDRPGMLKLAEELGLKIDPIERLEPKLLHARLSAEIARRDFKISDPEVLAAIAQHTIGAENMSLLSQIIYLADHMEEDRDFMGVSRIRELAYSNPDRAIFESTSAMVRHLLDLSLPIFEGTIRTRNYYLTHAT